MTEQRIFEAIAAQGGRCFYVGGYVRDKIMGISAHDIDVECFHISLRKLETILDKFGPVLTIGKSFGILKLANYPDIDFALPRTETKIGSKHTDFQINVNPHIAYRTAAARRDFTCNAIMQDTLTGTILDFFYGQKDITDKILRHIDDTTFIEDPLRGLRAAQFAARFNFSIHPTTIHLIQTLDYSEISSERMQQEFHKGICSSRPEFFLYNLEVLGISNKVYQELQNLPLERATLLHALMHHAGNHTPSTLLIRATTLVYYLDSPNTLIRKITHDKKLQKAIATYLQALHYASTVGSLRDFRILKQMIPEWNIFSQLCQCIYTVDKTIIPTRYHNFKIFKEQYLLANQNNPTSIPLIQGRDLIMLGLQPNTTFKKLLKEALLLEIDGYAKDEILTKIKNNL